MIQIRRAVREDAAALAAIERAVAQEPGLLISRPHELRAEAFAATIDKIERGGGGVYLVAEREGTVVGHALLDSTPMEGLRHVVRLNIVVAAGREGQGIGEVLLREAIRWAQGAADVEKIELSVRASNLRAIRLYQKLGFAQEGRLRGRVRLPDGSFVDDLTMGLFVKASAPQVRPYSGLAIGWVEGTRKEIRDDEWDDERGAVVLDPAQFGADALAGLADFSHVEVVFHMDQVDVRKIQTGARRPRGNPAWPEVGIFAQRAKWRPNGIATTVCRIEKIEGLRLWLKGLDAIDRTPVLDLKPWVDEFGPRGPRRQPAWMTELMREYWQKK